MFNNHSLVHKKYKSVNTVQWNQYLQLDTSLKRKSNYISLNKFTKKSVEKTTKTGEINFWRFWRKIGSFNVKFQKKKSRKWPISSKFSE